MQIKLTNVDKTYPNGYKALSNINLTINQGEFVSLIGLSGAGKTTLVKTINGLNNITNGEIKVGKFTVNKLKTKGLRDLRRGVGIIFQGYNLVSETSVLKNTLNSLSPDMPFYRRALGLASRAEKNEALASLASVGLLRWAYTRSDQLSGGQMQRVALARTITQKPRIVLADEPVAALDPLMLKKVMDDFKRVNKTGVTVVANLHHVEVALKYADRIVGIKEGEIIYDGPSSKITVKDLKNIYGDKLKGFTSDTIKHAIAEKKILERELKLHDVNAIYNETRLDILSERFNDKIKKADNDQKRNELISKRKLELSKSRENELLKLTKYTESLNDKISVYKEKEKQWASQITGDESHKAISKSLYCGRRIRLNESELSRIKYQYKKIESYKI